MDYKIVVQEQAQHDVAEAIEWYLERNTEVAGRFKEQFLYSVEKAAKDPFIFPVVYKKKRKVSVRPFPYNVYFEVLGSNVVIHACIHMHRSPRIWKKRLR